MTRPLPQWTPNDEYSHFTATAPDGDVWVLWREDRPHRYDPLPPGYRLAPVEDRYTVGYIPKCITADHGLYFALDMAGLHIAKDTVRADPEGAARQMGLEL